MTAANAPKRIYAYTVVGKNDQPWKRLVGTTLTEGTGQIKVGETTKPTARARIREQLQTAYPGLNGVDILLDESANLEDGGWFSDHDVHRVLVANGVRNVGGEWFEASMDDVNAAINEVRSGISFDATRTMTFPMRPEQQNAVDATAAYFREHEGSKAPHFLWNAKMRFGKTFTTYQLAREMGWDRILVLTYKPAVQTAWKEDLLSHVDFSGWQFVDKDVPFADVDESAPLVWFASFQDLKGTAADGQIKARNEPIHVIDWDCIVIDEYHFGAWREGARELYDPTEAGVAEDEEPLVDEEVTESEIGTLYGLSSNHFLYLSGTPFRAVANGEFTEDQVFNWTYIDEQREKTHWTNPDRENPYLDLPQMQMFTYRMGQEAENHADDGEFNGFTLNEFFKAKKVGADYEFDKPDQVKSFLNMLRGQLSDQMKTLLEDRRKPPFPYESAEFASAVQHSVWYLPNVGSCFAMASLLREHPYFSGYDVVVSAGSKAGMGADAKPPVERAIYEADMNHKSGTITLSCGKLMTGVTIREWSSIFMLRSLKSPESYFQAAFRVQSPWSVERVGLPREVLKETCFVFEFDPNRALMLLAEYGTRLASSGDITQKEALGELINYLPVFAFDGASMSALDAEEVLNWATAGIGATALAQRWSSHFLVDVNAVTLERLLSNEALMAALEQIEDFRNLRTDAQQVITSSKKLKDIKRAQRDATPEEKTEQKESNSLRKQIRDKLLKFVAKVPVFMYLTDHREEALKHVIEAIEPELFERVTGLTVEDFKLLNQVGVFNPNTMNDAIWQFRQFERASLGYADDPSKPHPEVKAGGWDRSADEMEAVQ